MLIKQKQKAKEIAHRTISEGGMCETWLKCDVSRHMFGANNCWEGGEGDKEVGGGSTKLEEEVDGEFANELGDEVGFAFIQF